MRRMWLAFGATLAVALPAAVTATAGGALAALAPRLAALGAHPGLVTVRHGGNAAGGAELWRARYGKPSNNLGSPSSPVVSPDGSRVYIAGTKAVAYDAVTGAQRWAAPTGLVDGRFPSGGLPGSRLLALSPDGSRVFVAGSSLNGDTVRATTRAFDAATGTVLWTAVHREPGTNDQAHSVAVSPDGSRVFITGESVDSSGSSSRYTTIAYDAATGARRWVAHYGYQHLLAGAVSIAVSPDGTRVFVTGASVGPQRIAGAATVSYDAATGATQWVARYNAMKGLVASALAVAVNPDGSTVYIAGTPDVQRGRAVRQEIAVVAYTAAAGTMRWAALYPGPADPPPVDWESSMAMALSLDGSVVFVAAQGVVGRDALYSTVAFDAATGARRWARQSPLNGYGLPAGIAVTGTEVFVTGFTTLGDPAAGTSEYATVAYAAATGAERWTRLYTGSAPGLSEATGVAVSPDGTRVFVTGGATGPKPVVNYTTLAYSP